MPSVASTQLHFRRVATSCAAALWIVLAPGLATAQDANLAREIERLRQDLGDLQRFVYRGGGPAPGATAGTTATGQPLPNDVAARLQLQMQEIRSQLRELTGQVEESQFAARRLEQRLDRLVADVDLRLQALESGRPVAQGTAAAPSAGTPVGPTATGTTVISSQGVSGPDAAPQGAGEAGLLPGQRSLGTVDGRAVQALEEGRRVPTATTSPGGDDAVARRLAGPGSGGEGDVAAINPAEAGSRQQYDRAVAMLRQRDYARARAELQSFLQANPEHPLGSNAIFWLGEISYVEKDFGEAARMYLDGFQRFPDGNKAPDSLLKLGMSLAEVGETESACATFRKLRQTFPNADPRIVTPMQAEVSRLKCT